MRMSVFVVKRPKRRRGSIRVEDEQEEKVGEGFDAFGPCVAFRLKTIPTCAALEPQSLLITIEKERHFPQYYAIDAQNACHVLVEDNMQSVYTLRNYGRNANCSLTALFPVKVSLLALSVGITMTGTNFKVETGTMKKCQETGHKDYLEVSGGTDFAVPKVLTGVNLCGLDSYPGRISETVLCGVSSVTLFSSGEYDNSATVAVRQATEEDIMSPAALLCP